MRGVKGIVNRLQKGVRAQCEILLLLVQDCRRRVANEGCIVTPNEGIQQYCIA